MVKIKFTKYGANSAFGGFSPGDIMRCDQILAEHLVAQGVAHIVNEPSPPIEPSPNIEPPPNNEAEPNVEAEPHRATSSRKKAR